MIPRTKIQKRVDSLKNKVTKITKQHENWAYEHLFKHYVFPTKGELTCMDCGRRWGGTILNIKGFTTICPGCHHELILWEGETRYNYKGEKIYINKRVGKTFNYMILFDTCKEFQVIRTFYVIKYEKVLKPADYLLKEVYQHWFHPNGKHVIRAILRNPMGYYMDAAWSLGSPMEIRGNHSVYYQDGFTYPKRKIIPIIRRNGFKKGFFGLHPAYFFQMLLNVPHFETILKSKQYKLLKKWDSNNLFKPQYWNAIKICIRNNYIIKEPDIWFDYIDLLEYFGKDLHSAKYLCPENLRHEHDKLVSRKNKILVQEKIRELSMQIEKDNKIYLKDKSRFLDLNFSRGNITIQPLQDVREFLEEGEYFHHCIFSNEYHLKKDALIMSARYNDIRTETVHVSLSNMEIVQSRGFWNKSSRYHKQIVNLTEEYLPEIQKRLKQKVKL